MSKQILTILIIFTFHLNSFAQVLESSLIEKWINKSWVVQGKTENIIDKNRNIIRTTSKSMDTLSNSWKVLSTKNMVYNEEGSVLETIQYNWNAITQDSNLASKYEYIYDSLGQQITFNNYFWTNNEWLPYIHETSEYDKNNNLVLVKRSRWIKDSQEWVNFTYTTYSYNVNNQLTEVLYSSWDVNNETWVNNSKTSYSYNNNSITIISLRKTNDIWVNQTKITNQLNDFGMVSLMYAEYLNKDSNKLILDNGQRYKYDENNNLIELLRFGFDESMNEVPMYKNTYKYQIFTSVRESDSHIFSIYPNPANNLLTINQNTYNNINYSIIDLQGKVHQTGLFQNLSTNIQISTLPSNSYIIVLKSKNGIERKQFIKL